MLNYVDTRQGTNNQYTFSNGNALPYTGVPFGMNHYVVQTKTKEAGSSTPMTASSKAFA